MADYKWEAVKRLLILIVIIEAILIKVYC